MQLSQLKTRRVLLLLALLLPVLAHADAGQIVTRKENPSIAATVTSFQTSVGSNGWRYVTTTVHFENRTKKTLALGSDRSKVSATDDQGNRYAVLAGRGLGAIAGTNVDPKFVLPPGVGGDALFEMRWRGERNTEFGITFDLDVAVREVDTLPSGQLRLGQEHLFGFSGLKNGYASVLTGAPAISEHIVDAGPFMAQITRSIVASTANRRYQTVNLTMTIKNTSDKPLILAYESGSSYGTDDVGNRFLYGNAGSHDTSTSGIGMTTTGKADPQFVLAPGESREARFSILRQLGTGTVGTAITYYVALQQLEILPSDQIRELRQFSLTFPGIPVKK